MSKMTEMQEKTEEILDIKGPLVILDVACFCLWLFSLYINIKIGKISI